VPHGNFILIGGTMQARYQYGDLRIRKRNKGPDVWQFRFFENGKRKSVLIGTVEKLPTKADAERAVEHRRIQVNAQNPQQQFHEVTVGRLIDRFMAEYAPKRCRKTHRAIIAASSTITSSQGGERIRPERQDNGGRIDWLDEYPRSRQVKSHVRNLMHTLFQAAIRWEIVDGTPVDLVRQTQKRLKTPRILTPAEFKALLGQLLGSLTRRW
jgi:integrase